MKASFKFFLAALAATVTLAGCVQEITPPNFENDKVNPAAEGSRVIAVSFGPQTKTTLDGFQPKFANKDSILISNGEALDTCEVKVDGKGATITTNLTGPLTALYPAKFVESDLDFEIPSVQSGKFSDANLCYAVMEGEDESSLQFVNYSAILKFYVDESIGVTSLKITSSGKSIAKNSYTIIVKAPEDKTLADVTDDPGKRICYVALDCGKDLFSNQLAFEIETTTQGTVTRAPTNTGKVRIGYMYNAFIPYYIEVNGQKWGYCNIGAFLPEEPGDYFAWGEVNGHKADTSKQVVEGEPGEYSYIMDAFAADFKGFDFTDTERYTGEVDRSKGFSNKNTPYYLNLDGGFSKYTDSNSVTLQSSDDAATTNWGGGWRMPTKDEFETLINGTSTDENDFVGGGLKIRGTELLFPAVGFADNMNLTLYAELDSKLYYSGFYWSSTLYSSSVDCAWHLDLLSDYRVQLDYGLRQIGGSIRPIYGPAPTPTEPTSEYVEIAADYDNNPNTANTTLKWYRQNLAITDSGKKSWKGNASDAVKVPGTDDDVIVGDYFQWAASYGGYNVTVNQEPDSLLIYTSFTNKGCGESEDKFTFIGSKQFNQANAPYGGASYTKYNDSDKATKSVLDTTSTSNDDVASIILGGKWRMPTSAEFKAMKDATYWAWDSDDQGYYVFWPGQGTNGAAGGRDAIADTDNKAAALLFFPTAGSGDGTDLNAGGFGYYWSSSLDTDDTDRAYDLYFDSCNGVLSQSYDYRYGGFPVRPVCPVSDL